MGTRDESHEKEKRSGPFKCIGLESMVSEIESLSPEDEFYVWAQHPHGESQKIGCESPILDEIRSAACDCHGDSCCC